MTYSAINPDRLEPETVVPLTEYRRLEHELRKARRKVNAVMLFPAAFAIGLLCKVAIR